MLLLLALQLCAPVQKAGSIAVTVVEGGDEQSLTEGAGGIELITIGSHPPTRRFLFQGYFLEMMDG